MSGSNPIELQGGIKPKGRADDNGGKAEGKEEELVKGKGIEYCNGDGGEGAVGRMMEEWSFLPSSTVWSQWAIELQFGACGVTEPNAAATTKLRFLVT